MAKENKLDVELVETKPPVQDIEYFKLNALGKIPTFKGSNDYILTEALAIAVYCMLLLIPWIILFAFHKMNKIHIINSYPWLNILLTILRSEDYKCVFHWLWLRAP